MTIFTRIALLVAFLLPLSLLSCRNGDGSNITGKPGDLPDEVVSLSVENPRQALALIDSAESGQLMTPFECEYLRCVTYHNGLSQYRMAILHGTKAYEMPEARDNADNFLALVEMLADEYLSMGDHSESTRLCAEGLELAKDSLLIKREANLHVTMGLNLLDMNQDDEAFRHFSEAEKASRQLAADSDGYEDSDNYLYTLGVLANALSDKGKTDRAIELTPGYLKAAERLDSMKGSPRGLADMRLAEGYAFMAYLNMRAGNKEEAEKAYAKYLATAYSSDPEGERLRIPYLLEKSDFGKALEYLAKERSFWKESADTLSAEYADSHLAAELRAYEGLGDLKSANRTLKSIIGIKDTLKRRDIDENALRYAHMYKSFEQAAELKRQSLSITYRNIVIILGLSLLICAVIFIYRIMAFNRSICLKNKAMARTIDSMIGLKEEIYEKDEQILGLRDRINELTRCDTEKEAIATVIPDSVKPESKPDDDIPTGTPSGLTERDEKMFRRLNHEILNRKLFLDAGITKKELTRMFNIPVNKFPLLFREYAGRSFSQYMQDCRLDYAASLIKKHPEWSLDHIAMESGMSKSAFYDSFKKKYGLTPTEFRNLGSNGEHK